MNARFTARRPYPWETRDFTPTPEEVQQLSNAYSLLRGNPHRFFDEFARILKRLNLPYHDIVWLQQDMTHGRETAMKDLMLKLNALKRRPGKFSLSTP